MPKRKKSITKSTISILFLILVAGGIFLYLNFSNIAKNLTEKIASDALGVKVRIASLDIFLQDKEVIVNGLRIGNPPGYKNANVMTAEKITIELNTVSKELIDFKNIRVDGSVINLEVTEKGNNLSDLKKLTEAKPQKESVGSEQVRVIVKNITIGSSTLNPSITLLGNSLGSITIPPVSLSGIGKRQNGVVAADAIKQVLTKYMSVAERKADTTGLINTNSSIVDAVGGEIKDLGKSIGGLFGD